MESDAFLGVLVTQQGAEFGIETAKDLGQHFDDGNLGTKAVVEAGKFHTDDTATDDDQGGRLFLEGQDFTVGQDAVAGFG